MATVHSVNGAAYLLHVVFENNFGVVGWEKGELECHVCSGLLSSSCDHVKEVSKILEYDGESPDFVESFLETRDDRGRVGAKSSWLLRAKLYNPIPFYLPGRLKQIMFETSECQIQMGDEGASLFPAIPETSSEYSVCPTCKSAWQSDSPTLHGWLSESCKLILRRFFLKCVVYYRALCNECLEYDGGDVALLNMGKFLISYDILRDFMFHFLMGRCTMYTYYNVWAEVMNDGGKANLRDLISIKQWQASWYAFLDLLDIDYDAGFCCPICQTNSLDVLVFDGTSLGFRQAFLTTITEECTTQSNRRSGR